MTRLTTTSHSIQITLSISNPHSLFLQFLTISGDKSSSPSSSSSSPCPDTSRTNQNALNHIHPKVWPIPLSPKPLFFLFFIPLSSTSRQTATGKNKIWFPLIANHQWQNRSPFHQPHPIPPFPFTISIPNPLFNPPLLYCPIRTKVV